jgi:hypothetical protein
MANQVINFGSASATINGVANVDGNSVGGTTSLTPAPSRVTQNANYLTAADYDFTQQFLPDLYEKEFARYGDRSVSSFLRMVGAEMPSNSDLIKWSEQGRLHITGSGTMTTGNTITFTDEHNFRVNQTVVVTNNDGTLESTGIITAVSSIGNTPITITVSAFGGANLTVGGPANGAVKVFVYGSEFKKGSDAASGSYTPDFESKENNHIIIKDKYEVSGSEMTHVGWVEVEGGGYLWYLKAENETRQRFEDYLETAMIEGEPAIANSAAANAGYKGTKGLFYTIKDDGNVTAGDIGDRTDLENIAKVLDKEGAIQENVIFANRDTSFDIDNTLAAQNNSGASTSSYGLFDNDEAMALNLGFTGFRIGYDFYKTDWKYLNDATTRGGNGTVTGMIAPAGTTNVYDEIMGESVKRPFLHVRYRVSPQEDRRYKSWITGSAGGAATSGKDNMEVHFLSERALCVMGANNFLLME